MWKKLFSVFGFIVILIVGAVGNIIGKKASNAMLEPPPLPNLQEIDAKLIEGFTQASNQFNQQLPMMVDQDTRLDKTTVEPGPRLVYHYTFPKYTLKNVDINALQKDLRMEIEQKVCTNADMKKSIQYGGIFVYAYSNGNGVEKIRFEINRNDCGFPILLP